MRAHEGLKRILVEMSKSNAEEFIHQNKEAYRLSNSDVIALVSYVDSHCYDVDLEAANDVLDFEDQDNFLNLSYNPREALV